MKKLVVVMVVAVIGVVGWRMHSHRALDAGAQDGRDVLAGRVWLDRMPTNDRDSFNVFALLPNNKIGVFQTRSVWRGVYEAFRYQRSGGQLDATFPQSGDTEQLTIKARRCNERGMDFCLDITGNSRGAHRYYSRKDWVIKSLADEQALVDQLAN